MNGSSVVRAVSLNFNRRLGATLYQYSYTPGEVKIDDAGQLIPYGASFPNVADNLVVTLGPQAVMVMSTVPGYAGTIPAAPSGLRAVAGNQSVSLSWDDNSANEDGFRVERKAAGKTAFVRIGTVPANTTTFVDSLVSTTSYQYRVCAYRTEGCSDYSSSTVTVSDGRGILGWWPFMGDLTDRTGQHTHSIASAVSFATDGRNGSRALHLNGYNSFVDLDSFTLGDQFSFALWVKMDESSNLKTILSNRKGGCSLNGFTLSINLFQTSNRQIQFGTGDGSSCTNALSIPSAVAFGEWTYLAVTVDLTAKLATIYLNGTDVTSEGNKAITANFSRSGTLRLGAMLSNDYSFEGAIQDLRIYDYLLSGIEVQELAYAGFPQ